MEAKSSLLISEVDRKLDKMCVLALHQESPWFRMASRMEKPAPAYIFSESDKTMLQIDYPRDQLRKQDISAIMANPAGMEKRTYLTITERINNVKHFSIVSEIMDLPSVVATNSYLSGQELFVSFRFHRSVQDDLEVHLATLFGINGRARIAYMGKSPGIVSMLDRLNAETPISIVQVSLDLSSENTSDHPMLTAAGSGAEILGEADLRNSADGGARTIIYSKQRLGIPFPTLSEEDFIYESRTNIATFMEGRRMGNEARIPRLAVFLRVLKDRLVETTFIPTTEAGDYISQLFHMMSTRKKSQLRLEVFSPLQKGAWTWL
ncbi:MAG: hypothetical protein M1151_07175 [Candidatus Thermoplasmatota archaeon]|nr:hypothetical protein [Candidatus Thermoplasmatota archaeon]MCL5786425.1 hypothetical protein [Candidatus Thermoplasmatota archaeon]